MSPVDKAIWYIENHYREPVSLDTLAAVAGVSRYHLSRIFCFAVGQPISRYLRLRRLSRAAQALAAGESDILNLALSLGYGSHEAFSRAFKEQFDRTPEQVRRQGHTTSLTLLEATLMNGSTRASLAPPRTETAAALHLAGLSRHYAFTAVGAIPDQWQSLANALPGILRPPRPDTFGVIYNGGDDGFDYLTGIELRPASATPPDLVRLELPSQTYVVFEHRGHVAGIRETCNAIWNEWLPESALQVLEAPWFERYGAAFDPRSGHGGLEVWIPVEPR